MTRTASAIEVSGASEGLRQTGQRITSNVRPVAVVIAKARQLWTNKVAVELAARAGVSVRSAENYLAGDRDMNGNALTRLLQSDEGPAFLEAIIAELPPSRQKKWRSEFEKAAERAASPPIPGHRSAPQAV